MPDLICTVEVDNSLIDQFSAKGVGFPDQTMLDPDTGAPDPVIVERMVGMSRTIRRMEQANVKAGLRVADFLITSEGRLKLLLKGLYNVQTRSQKRSKAIGGVHSWERVIFTTVDPSWQDAAGAAAQRFDEFTPGDRDALDTMFNKRIAWVDTAKNWESEVRDFIKGRSYYKQLGGIVGILLDRLAAWDTLPDEAKQVVADGAYAVATPFGNELLGVFVTYQPELMGYYAAMLENEKKARQPHLENVEDQAVASACSPGMTKVSTLPMSLYQLYGELFLLVQQAKTDSGNLHYAEQIETLITSNLPRLKHEYALSEDAVRRILNECIDVLINIGQALALPIFEDDEFLVAFKTTWLVYFNERLREEVPATFFGDLTQERHEDSAEIKIRIEDEHLLCRQLDDTLADLNERIKAANFREKNELRNGITEAQESRVKSDRRHQDVEQEGCDLLLPPGYQVGTLVTDGTEVTLSLDTYHPSAKAAIQAWSSAGMDDLVREHPAPDCPDEEQPRLGKEQSASLAVDVDVDPAAGSAGELPDLEPDDTSDPAPQNEPESLAAPLPIIECTPATLPSESFELERPQDPAAQTTSATVLADLAEAPIALGPVEEEVNVSQFFNAPAAARERLQHCQQTMEILPAIAVENIALLWIKRGQLPLASKTLEIAGRMGLAGDLLSLPLVQAAYHGMHVWRGDSATVTRIQQIMNQLSSEIIESWIHRRPGGRVVPYLVFAASLQPTLFFGMMTNAPRLLASVHGNFDGPVARLIEEVSNFSSHNARLDLDTLREQPTTNDKDARSKLGVRLVEWHDRIQNKQTGWAPARKAMKECLARPDFDLVYQSITDDDASKVDEVRAFTDLYRDKEVQSRLMSSEISKMMSESGTAPQIEGNARNWFLRSVDEVVGIADLWVEGHSRQGQRSSEVSKFAPRFLTMLTAASSHLKDRLARTDDPEQQGGLHLAIHVLQRINTVAERHEETIWDTSRINGWLQWPTEWLTASLNDDIFHQLISLTSLLGDVFPDLALADQALERKNFRHALLLTLNHQDESKQSMTEKIETIKRLFSEEVYQCNLRSDQMRGLLDNANIASLIDDERHYQLRGELEHLQDQLKNLKMLDDLSEIHSSLDLLESSIVNKFTAKRQALEDSLRALVAQALLDRGVNWVPAAWLEQIHSALNAHDTTVAEEMLEHLKHSLENGTPLESESESGTELLKRFLTLEPHLFSLLAEQRNPREVIRHLTNTELPGLSLETLPPYYKLAIENLVSLRRRVKTLDKTAYEEIVSVLFALGLVAANPTLSNGTSQSALFSSRNRIAHFTLLVKRCDTGRGIVFFNQNSDEQSINVLLAHSDWTSSELKTLLTEQTQFLHDRTVLISGRELSIEERNDLAKFSKQQRHALLHIDPVLLTMLAGLRIPDHLRLKAFLQLSLPWTFSNPYTGNQMQPAPPEMRYGRENDIKALTTMRNGAAMIFGGRQLGKTTLLNETQRRFHKPDQRHHAYLFQIDGDLDRADLSGNELEKHRKRVWGKIYSAAVSSRLLKESYGLDTSAMVGALHDYFLKENADALMVCLDEIDPILGLDAANGFRIFRELSGLVNNSNGRFKVIIAGLENVRRFADAPNYPLHQLGSAIQVSIMSPAEALQLIREPLGHLGYEFESPLLMNRILVETNRHPGLIHIFCHELIQTLSARHSRRVGSVVITADDIEQIRKDPGIRQLICDRFDITLNLDLRYKLIAYSLISQSTNSFSPSRAKSIVQEWAPQIFEPMTEAQFEAFLDELCGLGVLQYMRRSEGGKEYALRNSNIMNLVGGQQNIEDKLLAAVDAINENDPMSAHAFTTNSSRPSPLTLRDEKLLITEEVRDKPTFGAIQARSSNYSVGVITGSEALGLNPQWMMDSLLAIGEEEPPITANQYIGGYSSAYRKDTELGTASNFKKLLIDSVMGVQAHSKNIMFFIEITGDRPIGTTLDLLDIAHEARLISNAKHYRVRVIFLMTPRALWQWESNPHLVDGRESMQPFIALDVWKETALAHLLNKLELENTSTSVSTLESYSQGWYFSLDKLLTAKEKKPDVVKVNAFGQAYSSLLQAKPKGMEEFLTKAGIHAVDWVRPLLTALCEQERFDEDDIELQLMEVFADINPRQALQWLTRLRLIAPCKGTVGKTYYRVTKSIKTALIITSPQENKA